MFPAAALIAHLMRQSGKSVSTSTSITPHAWRAAAPTCVRPIAWRTPLRAPSHPTTYRATIVRSPSAVRTRTSTSSARTVSPRNSTP